MPQRTSSRLQKIEDQKNTKQAIIFALLSLGFLAILLIIGLPTIEKLIIWMGNRNSTEIEKTDTIPPLPPRIFSNYEATNSAQVQIFGYSETDSKITLYLNLTKTAEIITNKDGEFKFNDIDLMDGENNLYAIATDLANNVSEKSNNLKIIFDNKAPDLDVISPANDANFYDEEKEIVVGGKTEVGINLRINDYVAIIDSEGNFAKRITLSNGENKILVKAFDQAGNETKKELTVFYQD